MIESHLACLPLQFLNPPGGDTPTSAVTRPERRLAGLSFEARQEAEISALTRSVFFLANPARESWIGMFSITASSAASCGPGNLTLRRTTSGNLAVYVIKGR